MDWDLLKAIVLGVFAVTVIISTTLVGLLYGALRTLRDTNADLRLRVGDLEKDRVADKAENASVTAERDLLRTMITGKVEWVALTDQLEEHHRQALAWWRKTEGLLTRILAAIGGAK